MEIDAGPVEQADDGGVDVPHSLARVVRSPIFGFAGCTGRRGRRQPCCRMRRYQVEGEAQTVPSRWARTASGAIYTDILHFRARVLVISGGNGGHGKTTLIPDTVLHVYSGDRAIRSSEAVASRRGGPQDPVVGSRSGRPESVRVKRGDGSAVCV